MPRILSAVALVFLAGGACSVWSEPLPHGRFVYHSEPEDVLFELFLPRGRIGQPMVIPFSAGSTDNPGPSVDGEIRGTPAQGLWTVTFADSFDNSGRGTALIQGGIVFLTLNLETVVEPRCARYYGSMRLMKRDRGNG